MTAEPKQDSAVAEERTVICQGCENECEVSVGIRDGQWVCLGGNNCPTGASFAVARAADGDTDNKEPEGRLS